MSDLFCKSFHNSVTANDDKGIHVTVRDSLGTYLTA